MLALAGLAALVVTMTASANVALTQIFADPFTNSTSQHKTAAEPDTFSFGSTIVAAVQSGRFFDGGSSGIGWSTSTNNGVSWTSGTLPGITKFTNPAGPYDRATDPSVAYDAKHNVWMVSTLALTDTSGVLGASQVFRVVFGQGRLLLTRLLVENLGNPRKRFASRRR